MLVETQPSKCFKLSESLLTTFSYYLGRIDGEFSTIEEGFQVKYGEPEDLQNQGPVDDAIEIAT